jgi:hypothetical protein
MNMQECRLVSNRKILYDRFQSHTKHDAMDMYFGRANRILEHRKKIKQKKWWIEGESIMQPGAQVKFILMHFLVISNLGKCMSEIYFTMQYSKSQNFKLNLNN